MCACMGVFPLLIISFLSEGAQFAQRWWVVEVLVSCAAFYEWMDGWMDRKERKEEETKTLSRAHRMPALGKRTGRRKNANWYKTRVN